jgi:enoyl-CoA hydratase
MSGPTLHTATEDSVAILTLDRPPMNALDQAFCATITEAFERVAGDESIRAVVLTGNGPAFSAGVDLQIVPDLDFPAQDDLINAINRMVTTLYGAPVPVVAAVNGHAIAGGAVLALCADYRVASPSGRHGLSEIAVGVRFPATTLEAVLAELDAGAARRLIFSGALVDSEEARALGLYDEVAEAPLERALEVARTWSAHSRGIYADVKAAVRRQALARMTEAVAGGDPLAGDWLSDETRALARSRLGR